MITLHTLTLPAFIVDDPHPEETVCSDWYPRYGHILAAKQTDEETVTTSTGTSYLLERVTWLRWKNGVMYKINKDGWPLALRGMTFEEAKNTMIYKLLYK